MEDKIVSLSYLKKQRDIRDMDLSASFEILSSCLKMLSINDLPENMEIKSQNRKAMLKLERAKK